MSKRCKLQKEYYKEFGDYKGFGKYTDHYVKWLESKVLAINRTPCCETLPTKETVILEGEKQILDWLEENDEREKQAYRVGFRRSFEYVLRLMNK